jgi:hypothetical protein
MEKGWEGPSHCYLCKCEIENTDMFIHCNFIKFIWDRLAAILKFKLCWKGRNFIDCMQSWVNDKKVPLLVAVHTYWYTWIKRNRVLFEEWNPSIHFVIPKILGLLSYEQKDLTTSLNRSILIQSRKDMITA